MSTHTYLALERVFGLTTFILLWLVPMGLNMSLSYIINNMKGIEISQIQLKARARLRIKLQFTGIIICLAVMSISQIILNSLS